MKNNLINPLWFGLLLLGVSQVVLASSYKVEVLVFAHKQPSSEIFNQTTSTLKPSAQSVEIAALINPEEGAIPEEPLTGLSDIYGQILRQPNYNFLLKKAWIQTIADNQPTPAVHLENADLTLHGYISLITNGAMTMQVDVEYASIKDTRFDQQGSVTPIVYRLTENRPLKFNESHYFDHPVIGVILLVTPL